MGTSRTHTISAFIARKVQYGESDLILTLLSREEGRLDVIARGARKSRRRFEAGLSYYMLYEGSVTPPRTGSLWLLGDMCVTHSYPGLLGDFRKIASAAYGTELIREMAPPHQEDEPLFSLLVAFYEALDALGDTAHLVPWLQYNALVLGGFVPPLHGCASCHREGGDGGWALSGRTGIVLCESCAPPGVPRVSWAHLSWLFDRPSHPAPAEAVRDLAPLISRLTTNVLGKPLKTGVYL